MSIDPTAQLQELFLRALEVPEAELESWLYRRCGSDQQLQGRVLELIKFHNQTSSPIDTPAIERTNHRKAIEKEIDASQELVIPGYSVTREMARGGQSVVFEAVQESTSQKVAIKLLLFGVHSSNADRERQAREVQILAKLQHPHIIGLIDRGTTESECDYVVTPFVDGRPIDEFALYLNSQLSTGDPSSILQLFEKVARAVGFAHTCGVVHRDLKPSNILVDRNGEPKLLDFGIARMLHGQNDALALTVDGSFLGSIMWASPEQAGGANESITPRTDVYSLGVILYQMLTGGRFPYEVVGNMRDVLNNIVSVPPTPPSSLRSAIRHGKQLSIARDKLLNPAIDAIVLKTLSKEPEYRYKDANALADDITAYLAGRQTIAQPTSVTLKRGPKQHIAVRWLLYLCFVTVILVAGASNIGVIYDRLFDYTASNTKQSDQEKISASRGTAILNTSKSDSRKDHYLKYAEGDVRLAQSDIEPSRKSPLPRKAHSAPAVVEPTKLKSAEATQEQGETEALAPIDPGLKSTIRSLLASYPKSRSLAKIVDVLDEDQTVLTESKFRDLLNSVQLSVDGEIPARIRESLLRSVDVEEIREAAGY